MLAAWGLPDDAPVPSTLVVLVGGREFESPLALQESFRAPRVRFSVRRLDTLVRPGKCGRLTE